MRDLLMTVLQGISFTFEDLSKWYNGYHSGNGDRLYNPWSIARALQGNKLRSYWIKSGKNCFGRFAFTFSKYLSICYDQVVTTRIHHLLGSDNQFREQIEKLIVDQPISFELDEVMTYSSFVAFLYLFNLNARHQVRVPEMSTRQLWTFLSLTGYLTLKVMHIFAFRTTPSHFFDPE